MNKEEEGTEVEVELGDNDDDDDSDDGSGINGGELEDGRKRCLMGGG